MWQLDGQHAELPSADIKRQLRPQYHSTRDYVCLRMCVRLLCLSVRLSSITPVGHSVRHCISLAVCLCLSAAHYRPMIFTVALRLLDFAGSKGLGNLLALPQWVWIIN